MSNEIEHTVSSGNVFADLGLPDAETLLIKAELVRQISLIIQKRRFTQAQTAQVLGLDQPKVSALLRGRLRGFSLERLTRFLNALGRDVEIVVRPSARKNAAGKVRVVAPGAKTLHQGKKSRTTTAKRAAKVKKKTRTRS